MSLGKKTVQGVFWNYFSFASGKLLAFLSTIILARLGLGPDEFGQVAIALLAVSYLDAIGDLGVASALIYHRDNVERASHVAFGISVATGCVLWIGAWFSAPFVAQYFGEPDVVPMLRVLAFTILIQSFGNVPMALLSKELEFRRRLIPDLSRNLSKGLGAILFALFSFGPWSLIWGQVFGVFAGTIALWLVQPYRPKWIWDLQLGRRLMSYGVQILLIEILAVVWSTIDYILIGRYLGKTELGLYQTAFRISDLLIINICWVAGRVLFSSFAKVNNSTQAVQHGYLKTLRYITLVTLPISIGLSTIAPPFVRLFFGSEWLGMIPVLQLLALRAGITTISFNSGHVLKAIGRPNLVNYQMVVKLTVLVVVVLMTLQFGYIFVALGQVGVGLLSAALEIGTIMYVLRVPARAIWRELRSPLIAALGMGLAVWWFVGLFSETNLIIGMVGGICVGAAVYLALLWSLERQFMIETARFIKDALLPERLVSYKR